MGAIASATEQTQPFFIRSANILIARFTIHIQHIQRLPCAPRRSGRTPATLRMNRDGQLLVRGATAKRALDAKAQKQKGAEFEVRTEGLRSVHELPEDLRLNAQQQRAIRCF